MLDLPCSERHLAPRGPARVPGAGRQVLRPALVAVDLLPGRAELLEDLGDDLEEAYRLLPVLLPGQVQGAAAEVPLAPLDGRQHLRQLLRDDAHEDAAPRHEHLELLQGLCASARAHALDAAALGPRGHGLDELLRARVLAVLEQVLGLVHALPAGAVLEVEPLPPPWREERLAGLHRRRERAVEGKGKVHPAGLAAPPGRAGALEPRVVRGAAGGHLPVGAESYLHRR
mmetsp:Transcript_70605/g.223046  ORF Transcript_70605/g.223046 Transcript_70605/m.223046 type:complete len:229 (-) Transcript_70605:200-886(-)